MNKMCFSYAGFPPGRVQAGDCLPGQWRGERVQLLKLSKRRDASSERCCGLGAGVPYKHFIRKSGKKYFLSVTVPTNYWVSGPEFVGVADAFSGM